MAVTGTVSLTINQTVTVDGVAVSVPVTLTGKALLKVKVTVPNSTTPEELTWLKLLKTSVAAVVAHCTRAGTLETNSSSAADDSLHLAANTAFIFYDGSGENPFGTEDTDSMFFTQDATGATAELTLLILLN